MAELKTKKNNASVKKFLDGIEDDRRRKDCLAILEIMRKATGAEPRMWGSSIVGFGTYHYKSDSGREGDWFLTGFSPRKQNLTLYVMSGFSQHAALLDELGKFKTGKACLYVNKLEDVDVRVLKRLIERSVAHMKKGA